ncbi:polyamine deacetylase HDAC10 isoform X1 [Conger conger]|uniref:polyamine deacetylase HDAC10 isoform X1 n=1 Tax=Conger conger TaxID=82655 RepID=UPI002A59ED10|nr:polyamine deacetylase HDAC10 isoform X1 [Conger conger]XP_061085464.1 polyamine deacetylase HDAC10 isoform X1 [Conger conger]
MASGTALVYDEEMTRYKLLWVDPTCKIEVPERLTVSYAALQQRGLAQRCVPLPVREATDQDILLAHSEEYLEAVKTTPHLSLEELMTFTQQYGDVYFHPNIYHCAKLAVGATLQLVDSVMTAQVRNGVALVRPPGHHSQRSEANGFCIFNNVAIATLYAQKRHNVKRVLIVDWDIHHGQGLQYCFEEDPSVLYFSWHRYQHQRFWPNLRDSDFDCVGKARGAGFNVNLPWNKVGMDNSDYLSAFFHVLLPVAYEFCPELVLVSAGFDSAIGDPEGHMRATPDVFAHLTHLLMPLAGGKLCAILEGGYNLTSLAQSVCQTVQTLLGDPAPRPGGLTGPCESALESVQCVRAAHRQYWACFKHTVGLIVEPSTKLCKPEEEDQGAEEEAQWPEPPPRPAPPIRTAAVVPPGARLPDSCSRETGSLSQGAEEALRNMDPAGLVEGLLPSLGNVFTLVDKIVTKKVRNGLALVPDVPSAVSCVVQKVLASGTDRVLLVFLGEGEVPVEVSDDGRVLVLQICTREVEKRKSQYHVPVCLEKTGRIASAFVHAVLSLVLPVGYGFDPGLVLLALGGGGGGVVGVEQWAQLTALLQGLAQGQTLALLQQESGEEILAATASSLLGGLTPSLGPLGALDPLEVQEVETQRHRLQDKWGLLRTAARSSSAEGQRQPPI